MKQLKIALLALTAGLLAASCSEDDPTPTPNPEPTAYTDAVIINQGNMYGGLDGTLGTLDLTSWQYAGGVFQAVNNQSLGDSPQGGIRYGSKIYVPMYGDNLLWVLDAKTLTILAQVETNEPEGVTAGDGYVFVSNNDGYVSRLDTVSYTVDTRIAVGPNPASLVYSNGDVYVSISDGYNYTNGYADGFRVAVIDAKTATKQYDVTTGMNPGPIAADAQGNVFVVARGDYYTVMPKVQEIKNAATVAVDYAEGNLIACNGTLLYVLNTTTDWTTGTSTTTSKVYNTVTDEQVYADFFDAEHQPGVPVSIDVDRLTGNLYICSDNSSYGYAETGSVHVFSYDGTPVTTVAAGIHPCGVVFRY